MMDHIYGIPQSMTAQAIQWGVQSPTEDSTLKTTCDPPVPKSISGDELDAMLMWILRVNAFTATKQTKSCTAQAGMPTPVPVSTSEIKRPRSFPISHRDSTGSQNSSDHKDLPPQKHFLHIPTPYAHMRNQPPPPLLPTNVAQVSGYFWKRHENYVCSGSNSEQTRTESCSMAQVSSHPTSSSDPKQHLPKKPPSPDAPKKQTSSRSRKRKAHFDNLRKLHHKSDKKRDRIDVGDEVVTSDSEVFQVTKKGHGWVYLRNSVRTRRFHQVRANSLIPMFAIKALVDMRHAASK